MQAAPLTINSKQSNKGGGGQSVVLLQTAVQGTREQLWCSVVHYCTGSQGVPALVLRSTHLSRLYSTHDPGDELLPIGIKLPQSRFIVSGNTVHFVDAAAARRESRVPPEEEIQPLSSRTIHTIPRYIPAVVAQLRHRLFEL